MPVTDPRAAEFQTRNAGYRRVMDAQDPRAWLAALKAAGLYDRNMRMVQAVEANPDGFEMRGGNPMPKKSWLSQNLWWLGPAAIVGGSAAPLLFGGGGGAAAGGGATTGSLGGLYSAPAAVASQGVSSTAGGGGGMGLFSTIGKFFGSPGGSRAIDAAGNLIGGVMQNRAAGNAADIQDRYLRDALDYQKEQDERARQQYLEERARDWRIQDEDRGRRIGFEDRRQARLQPFWNAGAKSYQSLASLLQVPAGGMRYAPPVGTGVRRPALADLLRG